VFGIGADVDEGAWRGVFRQLVALGYARPDHEAYGALKLTEASRAVLRGEREVEMRRAATPVLKKRRRTTIEESPLLSRLKAWRLAEARAQSVPPYVVFHDSTLAAIADARPSTLHALAGISGVGTKKLERYGAAILDVLAPST
jgi:ATP-dependent DNA helicase RecQ